MSKELIEALDGTIALLEREALLTQFEVVRERRRGYAAILQAHRAALASQPVAAEAVADLVEGMSVSVDVSTSEADAGHRYFGTVTVAQEDPDGKHGLILLVQNAEPNFATIDLLCDCGHQDSDHDIGPDNPCLKCSCIRPNFYATAQTPAPVADAAPQADGGVTDFSLIADMLVHYASLVSEQHSSRLEEFHYVPAIEEQVAALKARGA